MPCRGCEKKTDEPTGLFEMKFVGRPNGKLLKGAPGNYEHGEVYKIPYRHSKFKYWELVEEEPVLVVPKATPEDSVYEEPPLEDPSSEEVKEIIGEPARILALEDVEFRGGIFGNLDLTGIRDDEVTVSVPELESEPDVSATLKELETSTRAQLTAFIKSQEADPNPEGKRYVSHAELLEIARSLLSDEV